MRNWIRGVRVDFMSDDFHFFQGICIGMCHGANKNTESEAMNQQ
jgi:hypothetical protein